MKVRIDQSWQEPLRAQFEAPYFETLTSFVRQRYGVAQVFPRPANIFAAFDSCPFDKVKVVILGQDPYHEPGQAHGLSFSVPEGTSLPPSLVNIFKEMAADTGGTVPASGDLSYLAKQGVLLLNATLTVEAHKAG